MTHVMFSYNWDHQQLVLEVYRVLKSNGIDIWVDREGSSRLGKMAGSTDDMMVKVTAPAQLLSSANYYHLSPHIRAHVLCAPPRARYVFLKRRFILGNSHSVHRRP